MKLKFARIKNFRSIREVTVKLEDMTGLVGSNGSGKSNVLRAIDAYYSGSPNITQQDFYNRNTTVPIEIDLTFHDFTDSETVMFASRISNGEMSVARVFDFSAGGKSGRYFGTSLQHEPFAPIRAVTGLERRKQYEQLRVEKPEYELPKVARADLVEPELGPVLN